MKTVKIYKITCTKAYQISEQGVGFSLKPWGENTDIIEGVDDDGRLYDLPDGFEVAESNFGDMEIYDKKGNHATITAAPGDNAPSLVTSDGVFYLKLSKSS